MVDDKMAWRAVTNRDRSFDGRFVTGVMTTGIYCRPSCAARHPRRENVRFFATAKQAEAAGLRACLRCRPNDVARDEAAVQAVIDAIRTAENAPGLDELAGLTGYSPAHLQRIFKRETGLSPSRMHWQAVRRSPRQFMMPAMDRHRAFTRNGKWA